MVGSSCRTGRTPRRIEGSTHPRHRRRTGPVVCETWCEVGRALASRDGGVEREASGEEVTRGRGAGIQKRAAATKGERRP
jgi:hypothetical protein